MNKIIKNAAVAISILFIACGMLISQRTPLFSDYAKEYTLYFNDGSFGAGKKVNDKEYPFFGGVKGESCVAYIEPSCESVDKILRDMEAKCVFKESTAYGTSYYCYSPKVKYREYLNGKAVNLHLFLGDDRLIMGAPLIYGGY